MSDLANRKVAEAFPVGEYLREEIEARDWNVSEFAHIIGRPLQAVSEILNGKKLLTVETAVEIARATGTEALTWLNLQNRYTLWAQEALPAPKLSDIERRAALANLVPMAELRKRGLIEAGDVAVEEVQVWSVLQAAPGAHRANFALAARRTLEAEPLSPAQTAWLAFSAKSARDLASSSFDGPGLKVLGETLTRKLSTLDALSSVPALFAQVGVRVVHLAAFKSGKIDGACFTDERGPIIAVSGRGNALDKLIFTLLHETAHVVLGHAHGGIVIDDQTDPQSMDDQEREADALASSWALHQALPTGLRISARDVERCAISQGVHPALVVGRLHFDGVVPWGHLNGLVPKVDAILARW